MSALKSDFTAKRHFGKKKPQGKSVYDIIVVTDMRRCRKGATIDMRRCRGKCEDLR